jgi:hypothetical protein
LGVLNSKYLLSYDFRIFYCPETFFIGAYKELNQETLKFELYTDNRDLVEYAYPIDVSEIDPIVKTILMGSISYLLSEQNLAWIKEFEATTSKNPDIWEDEKYVFNYLTLKIMLMGFSESKALDIAKSYFKYKREGHPVLNIKSMVKAINKNIDSKEFWITNKMIEFDPVETSFLKKVLTNKISSGFAFDYKYFEREYMSICNSSFSKENFSINSVKSYPIKKTKNLQDQTPYIFQAYESIMTTIVNNLVLNKFPQLQHEPKFLINLLAEMKNTLSNTMLMWEQNARNKN